MFLRLCVRVFFLFLTRLFQQVYFHSAHGLFQQVHFLCTFIPPMVYSSRCAFFPPMVLRWCVRVIFLFLTRLFQQVRFHSAHGLFQQVCFLSAHGLPYPHQLACSPVAYFLSAFLYASCSIVFSSRFLHSAQRIVMVLLLFCFVSYISICASPRPPPLLHFAPRISRPVAAYLSIYFLSVQGFFVVGFNDPLVELLPRTQISTTRQHTCFG